VVITIHWSVWTAAWCADHGKHGFRYLRKDGEQVAKPLKGQQSMFGEDPERPKGLNAYGKPLMAGLAEADGQGPWGRYFGMAKGSIPDRPDERELESIPFEQRAQALAEEVVRQACEEARASVGRELVRLNAAVRRAIAELAQDQVYEAATGMPPGARRALAFLRECLIAEPAETSPSETAEQRAD
jgi:hypothetical protein